MMRAGGSLQARLVPLLALGVWVGLAPVVARAQEAPATPEDAIFAGLFAPELIMRHRRAISLTDEQRDAITRLIQELQGRVAGLQWRLLDEMEELSQIVAQPRVDLDRSLDQMGRVLETEREIKQAHLEMLVRMKNLLSPEQQATLDRLRSGEAPPGD